MAKRSGKVEIVIIVPQSKEYEGVKHVFSVPPTAPPTSLPHGGTYVICELTDHTGFGQPLRLAIACMNDKYNYPCLALTERLLLHTEPEVAFLVGSACGKLSKVNVCDVVVSTDSVAYLGRGRRSGQAVNPRPHMQSVPQEMKDAIVKYTVYHRAERIGSWNRACQRFLAKVYTTLPADVATRQVFEVKDGIIASDDLVLEWSSEEEARSLWAEHVRDEAKAYDMESGGFSYACANRKHGPLWAVVRGISDHGIKNTEKHHLAAATTAAAWLQGFITQDAGGLFRGDRRRRTEPPMPVEPAHLQQLYSQLDQEQRKNIFVGKRRFIRETLLSEDMALRALQYAISAGGIREYEVVNPQKTTRSTTAIRLDRESSLWHIISDL